MKICNKSLKIMKILWQKCVNDEKLLESPKKIGGNLDTRKPAFRRSGVLRRLDKITFYDQDPCAGDSGGPLMYQDPDSGRWVIIGWLKFHFIKNIELLNIALQCECCPVSLFIVKILWLSTVKSVNCLKCTHGQVSLISMSLNYMSNHNCQNCKIVKL